jgi:hypothetical protein
MNTQHQKQLSETHRGLGFKDTVSEPNAASGYQPRYCYYFVVNRKIFLVFKGKRLVRNFGPFVGQTEADGDRVLGFKLSALETNAVSGYQPRYQYYFVNRKMFLLFKGKRLIRTLSKVGQKVQAREAH